MWTNKFSNLYDKKINQTLLQSLIFCGNMLLGDKMKLGVYVHIPFCKQKCLYCDFVSYANKEQFEEKYIEALKKEIKEWKKQNGEVEIETIYIGGGTPSYIQSKKICEIIELLDSKRNISTTIEVNPGTITKEKIEDYKNAGINRLSIGLQSTNNELLKEIGRIHTFEDFLKTYKIARQSGFENINVDLMIGLPNQSIKDIKKSLEEITKLNPEHISVYSLIIEENTPMGKLVNSSRIKLPDEDTERNMYWYVKDYLELKGYKHYEISNFAKAGFESKHNLDCWNQNEYIGFGAGAHSYINNKRFCNISNIEKYIENIENNNIKNNILINEIQTKKSKQKEYMILGLRKIEGISIQKFKNKFNENPIMLYKYELSKLVDEELIDIDGDNIKLTNRGLDLANLVWEEFI